MKKKKAEPTSIQNYLLNQFKLYHFKKVEPTYFLNPKLFTESI